jgi:hypothetical protein
LSGEELFVLDHDDFHRATLCGFADLVLVVIEVDVLFDKTRVVGHFKNLGSGILAQVANGASLINPNLFDSHDSFLSRM